MAVETNTVVSTDLAKAQSIDFVGQFNGGISKMLEMLGITRKMPMAEGSVIKTYKWEYTSPTDAVAEGDIIPLTNVKEVLDQTYTLEFDKKRKQVTAEAIQRSGFDNAISDTDGKLLREMQKGIRQDFMSTLAIGTGTVSGTSLQKTIAKAWAKVQKIFEDDGVDCVVFVNPDEVADYIGAADVTTQSAFGLTYLEGFTSTKVITCSLVPAGKVYATASENIVFAYAEMSSGALGKAFSFTTDESGYIGVTHYAANERACYDTMAMDAIKMFAEHLDGVVVGTIAAV